MSDNKLKIDVVLADVGESGAVLSDFVTQELHNTDMAKKADLVNGKVNPTQLPEFSELIGVTDNFSLLESNLRENINTSLAESKAYADSIVSVVMSKKADLVNGRVPKEQATNFKDIPGAKAAIDGLKQSLGQEIIGINDSLENNFAKLTNGKVSQTVLPTDLVYSDHLTREMNDVRSALQNTITQVGEELTVLETKTNNKFISKTEAEYFTKDIELKAAIDGLERKSYTSYASKIVETSKADLTYVDRALGALSSAATKFYPTLVLANADVANLQVNQPVQVGEVANGGLWYKATAGATSLTKSPYDPITQAKAHTNANALIKVPRTITYNKDSIARKAGRYFSTVEGFYDPTATGMCTELIPINPNFDVYVTGISSASEFGGLYWFDENGQAIIHAIRRNVTGLAELAAYIPANAAYLGLNTNVTTTQEVSFVVTQTIDELTETLAKPITFRRKKFYSKSNVELIAGSYYQSGVVAGGFHVRIPFEFGEKIVKVNRPDVENKTLYTESGVLILANSHTNVPTPSNTLNKAYFVLNVAPQSVTSVSQVNFSLLTIVDKLHVEKPEEPTDVVYEMSNQNFLLHPGRVRTKGANSPIYEYFTGYNITMPVAFNSDFPIEIQTDDTETGAVTFFDNSYSIVGTLTKIGNATIAPEEVPTGAKYVSKNLLAGKYATFIMTAGGESKTTKQGSTVLSLPPLIPVAVGVQMNLYYDNFRSNPVNSTTELFMYEGAKPATNLTNPFVYSTFQTERALQWNPTTEGLTETITAEIRELNSYTTLNKRTFDLVSVPNNNGAGRRKITMICGDSQIEPDSTIRKTSFAPYLKDLFEQQGDMNMLFAGTKNFPLTIYGETPAENRTINCLAEGYGGKQVTYFTTSASPFWNPNKDGGADIDFKNYMANLAASNPEFNANDEFDYFIFPMGVNDYSNGVSTPNIIARIKVMQDLLWRDFPNCVFIVSMPTQGSKFWSMDARRKWNIEYYEALIQEFTKPEYSGKVVIAATGIWTDNIYGSRQVRPYREPYKRIVDAKNLLINKYVQGGMTLEQAKSKVVDEYGLEVKERVLERWMDEYSMTTDIVHSSWISAAQQADCLYSTLRYLLQNP